METAILVMFLLLVKHFICDFPLQTWPYQYLNKGTYGHPGGILHSTIHVLGSFLVLIPVFGFTMPVMLCVYAEGAAHYHIDWAKVKVCKAYGMTPVNSWLYWWILGFDQLLHCLCYLAMTQWLIGSLV